MADPITIAMTAVTIVQKLSSAIGIKGATQHPSWNEANSVAQQVNNGLWAIFGKYSFNPGSDFSVSIANWIDSSSWWKVGNDQESGVPASIRSDPSPSLSTWKLIMWGIHNSPANKLSDGYTAINDCLSHVLPNYSTNTDLKNTVNSYFSALSNGTEFSLPGTDGVSSVIPAIKSIFGIGSGSSGSSGEDSSLALILFMLVIVVIFGMFIFKKKG